MGMRSKKKGKKENEKREARWRKDSSAKKSFLENKNISIFITFIVNR